MCCFLFCIVHSDAPQQYSYHSCPCWVEDQSQPCTERCGHQLAETEKTHRWTQGTVNFMQYLHSCNVRFSLLWVLLGKFLIMWEQIDPMYDGIAVSVFLTVTYWNNNPCLLFHVVWQIIYSAAWNHLLRCVPLHEMKSSCNKRQIYATEVPFPDAAAARREILWCKTKNICEHV